MAEELKRQYAEKGDDYFEYPRPEMLALFPAGAKRVLDVGCGAGAFGVELKKKAAAEVWGVEPDLKSFEKAVTRLDRAFLGFFDEKTGLPEKYFDCIFFNDVLEHMVDPAAALQLAKKLLAPAGRVIASIPNIAHFPTVWHLVFGGEWRYAERGILDRTHLRFFTRSSIAEMFTANGFHVTKLEGINEFYGTGNHDNDGRIWKFYHLFALLPNRHLKEMRFLQFSVVAEVNA
jgi:SAM-dependent methyltransferase